MNAAVALSSFEEAVIHPLISDATPDELDALTFGVIGIDRACIVRVYNNFESKAAGLNASRVLGQHLFDAVAPCMNNFMVAQRFEDALAAGAILDATIDYVLTLRMRPVKVKLRLLSHPDEILGYVLLSRNA